VSLGAAYSAGASLWALAGKMALMFAATKALEWVMEETDNEFLRGLAIVAYIALSVYVSGPGDVASMQNADTALGAVNSVSAGMEPLSTGLGMIEDLEMEELEEKKRAFQAEYEKREGILEKQFDTFRLEKDKLFMTTRVATHNTKATFTNYYATKLNTSPCQNIFDYEGLYDRALDIKTGI
jgi:hypothetical protein